ncbi:DMT family transporter [Clostridium tagluense]|uniref:DMT family transporter n=1 Tax=Clostridium TaxID=1485 RepID=UPI0013E99796|nr:MULTISPECIES: DMT family transporter [Clostridium]MBU3128214.1 DMT family transporter [Clostridium tagluense]MBW9158319.1 DMT family transporter [Clostridium tagluense]MBZ9623579.1 DMT family transporter [Clostridium sp. FP2]MCB2299057.1 DMT family transporter [Clostridium tagluense]MCB2314055.1 DMT family transporter [Clostridium tagluense]
MYKVSAVLIGILIAIMVTFNGVLANYTDQYRAILIIHIVGLIAVIIILLLKKEKLNLKKNIPFYLFSGGLIGVFVVFLNNLCFNSLGASLTLSLGIFGQLVLACFIDHYGLFGLNIYKFNKKKIIGFLIILSGLVTMIKY